MWAMEITRNKKPGIIRLGKAYILRVLSLQQEILLFEIFKQCEQ